MHVSHLLARGEQYIEILTSIQGKYGNFYAFLLSKNKGRLVGDCVNIAVLIVKRRFLDAVGEHLRHERFAHSQVIAGQKTAADHYLC